MTQRTQNAIFTILMNETCFTHSNYYNMYLDLVKNTKIIESLFKPNLADLD